MDFLQNHIEALIFCSPTPAKVADIKACLSEMFNADVPEEDITGALTRIEEKFQGEEHSFQLYKAGGGYQFLTKPAYQSSIGIMLKQQSKRDCLLRPWKHFQSSPTNNLFQKPM